MKHIFLFIICLISNHIYCQEDKPAFDIHTWDPPYHLSIPKDWGVEKFTIPISFAPEIHYKGVEDIRFAPGWAKKESEEYWTYSFLWYLDGKIEINKSLLEDHLKVYYDGLLRVNSDSATLANEKPTPTKTSFRKIAADKDDLETYQGSIEKKDFISRNSITLNCKIHLKYCNEDNKTAIYFELSPKPFAHNNWVNLNYIWMEFKCNK